MQNATFRSYMAAILKTCPTYDFYLIIIGFLDPENIRIDAKIVFLSGLQVKTSPKTKLNDCCVLLFNFGKCKCLHTGPGNTGMNYEMGGTILSKTVKEKDLRPVTMNATVT